MTVLLGLIAIFAILGLVFVGMSQRLPSQEQQGQNQQQPQSQNATAKQEVSENQDSQANGWTKIKKAVERNEKMLTAISTAVIAAFTIALAFATAFLYFSSEKVADAAKISADAAKQSADAVASIERPYFFIVAKVPQTVPKDGPFDSVATPKLPYQIANLGRVPGILRLAYIRCFLHPAGPLPDKPVVNPQKFQPAQSPIGAGVTGGFDYPPCEFDAPFTEQDWKDIAAGKKIPIFMAIATYDGALDYTYIYTATYRVDLFDGHTYAIGNANYNNDHSQRGRFTNSSSITIPNITWEKDSK